MKVNARLYDRKMSFWKKWWKKKNKDKKGAEYEDGPLPSETIFADNDLEKRIRARRNNLSVSRSGRYKAKGKERLQLTEDLFNDEQDYSGQQPARCNKNSSNSVDTSSVEQDAQTPHKADVG